MLQFCVHIFLFTFFFLSQQIDEVEIIFASLIDYHLWSQFENFFQGGKIKIFQIIYYPIIFYDLCQNSIFDNKFWHFIYIPKHLFALFSYVKYTIFRALKRKKM